MGEGGSPQREALLASVLAHHKQPGARSRMVKDKRTICEPHRTAAGGAAEIRAAAISAGGVVLDATIRGAHREGHRAGIIDVNRGAVNIRPVGLEHRVVHQNVQRFSGTAVP